MTTPRRDDGRIHRYAIFLQIEEIGFPPLRRLNSVSSSDTICSMGLVSPKFPRNYRGISQTTEN
jgi:hypothetical protein